MRKWKTRHDYIKAMRKRGYRKIGSGWYSSVYAKSHSPHVVKVGDDLEDAWPSYIAWAVKQGYSGKLAPRVLYFKIIRPTEETPFYVAKMERLRPTDVPEARHGGDDYLDTLPEKDEAFVTGLRRLTKQFKFSLDIHGSNVMKRRGGTLVITDPVSLGDAHGTYEAKTKSAYRSLSRILKRKRQSVAKRGSGKGRVTVRCCINLKGGYRMTLTQNGTEGRVYGGDCGLVHIPDGTRRDVGAVIAQFADDEIRLRAHEVGNERAFVDTLCPGCYMIALFNTAIHLANENGQSISELGKTLSAAFAKLANRPADGLTEEIEVILDPDHEAPSIVPGNTEAYSTVRE